MSKLIRSTVAILTIVLSLIPTATAQLTLGSGNSLFGGDLKQPLPIAEAFPFYVSIDSPKTLAVHWEIAEGHYLYRQQFGFALKYKNQAESEPVVFALPDGLKKQDQFFGDIEAYYEGVTVTLNLDTSQLTEATLVIQYQGCADWGFCYPPQLTEYPFNP